VVVSAAYVAVDGSFSFVRWGRFSLRLTRFFYNFVSAVRRYDFFFPNVQKILFLFRSGIGAPSPRVDPHIPVK